MCNKVIISRDEDIFTILMQDDEDMIISDGDTDRTVYLGGYKSPDSPDENQVESQVESPKRRRVETCSAEESSAAENVVDLKKEIDFAFPSYEESRQTGGPDKEIVPKLEVVNMVENQSHLIEHNSDALTGSIPENDLPEKNAEKLPRIKSKVVRKSAGSRLASLSRKNTAKMRKQRKMREFRELKHKPLGATETDEKTSLNSETILESAAKYQILYPHSFRKFNRYKCIVDGCGKRFRLALSLKNHIGKCHAKELDDKIDYYLENATDQENAWTYKIAKLKAMRLRCPQCKVELRFQYQGVKLHIVKMHKDLENYEELLKKAKEECLSQAEQLNTLSSCEICSDQMETLMVPVHMQQEHHDTALAKQVLESCLESPELKRLKGEVQMRRACVYCNREFPERGLTPHLKVCRMNPQRKYFRYCQCGYKVPLGEDKKFSKHKEKCELSKKKDYVCEECGRVCKSHSTYTSHKRFDHPKPGDKEIKDYPCQHCSKVYHIPCRLNRHLRLAHTDEKNYICDTCGHAFKEANRLKVHILTKHKNVFRFQCHLCGHKMYEMKQFKRHNCKRVRRRQFSSSNQDSSSFEINLKTEVDDSSPPNFQTEEVSLDESHTVTETDIINGRVYLLDKTAGNHGDGDLGGNQGNVASSLPEQRSQYLMVIHSQKELDEMGYSVSPARGQEGEFQRALTAGEAETEQSEVHTEYVETSAGSNSEHWGEQITYYI